MYLKNLEIQGFKSFVDKICLEFGDGITAIVGPNGCGKSNISDAIRWVMGEQSAKSLRGSRMEDVIFAGTEKRKPVGFAEVSLVLDNSRRIFPLDYDEITVTRRVYRSGESEYLINKAACRLRDIYELFMDTGLGRDGYSIIGQGRIDEILSNKSEDRRQVFEEAAGISKYRYRKNEAEKKLSETEGNLSRLTDILSEIEARIEPLRHQSEKAQKYLNLRDKLRTLDVNLCLEEIEESKKVLEETQGIYSNAKAELDEAASRLQLLQREEEHSFSRLRDSEGEIEKIKERLHSAEILNEKTKGEILLFENNIKANEREIDRIDGEIEELRKANEECALIVSNLDGKISGLEENRKESLDEIEKLNAELLKMTAETDSCNSQISALLEKKAEISHEIDIIYGKMATIKALEGNADERIAAIKEALAGSRARLGNYEKEYRELNDKKENAENKLSGLKDEREKTLSAARRIQKENEDLKVKYNDLSDEYNRKSSRLSVLSEMEKNMEGYSAGVKALLRGGSAPKNMHGVLAKLISTDEKYSLAVETALGGALQFIVVDNEEDAKKAIAYLKNNRLGRATFLPLTFVKGGRGSFDKDLRGFTGYLGLACDVVECDSIYRGIIENLLGQTALFDNIDNAVSAAKKFGHRFKIVTLEGEVLHAGGSISGGSHAKSTRLLGRKEEIAALSGEVLKLQKTMDKTEEQIDENTDEFAKLSKSIEKIDALISDKNGEIIKLQSDMEIKRHMMERETEEIENRENELALIIDASKNSRGEKEKLDRELKAAELAAKECDGKTQKARQKLKEGLLEKEKKGAAITELRMRVSKINSDIDMVKLQIKETVSRQNQNNEQIKKHEETKEVIRGKIEEIKKMAAQKKADAEEAVKRAAEFAMEIQAKTKERGEADEEMQKLKLAVREQNDKVNLLNIEAARLENRIEKVEERLDSAINRLLEDYDLTYSEALSLKSDIGDKKKAAKEAATMRNAIRSLGHVNIDAIEEYKEVSARHEFMTKQMDDLNKAKKELHELIREMTECMTKQFTEQFNIISERFSEVFSELFGGGNAKLSLADPDNVLESGIDIEVRPPGKKLQRLSLLSGGEMAFTAIALLFAILKVRPTPFCILDEIEAALDENNIARFADYLKKFSQKTQFIVVTHRRKTMESADILYGVTMQEKGVSKLLSMKLEEVETDSGEVRAINE